MKYFVTVGSEEVEVDIDGDQVRLAGRAVRAHLERDAHSPELRLIIDGTVHRLAVDGHVDGAWRLVEQGAVRDLPTEDERSRHIRSLAGAGKSASSGGILKAPMPGLVVRLDVAVGDQVVAGTPLVVLEAMKMENELKSTLSGVVTAIRVDVGAAVEKGATLLEIAAAD